MKNSSKLLFIISLITLNVTTLAAENCKYVPNTLKYLGFKSCKKTNMLCKAQIKCSKQDRAILCPAIEPGVCPTIEKCLSSEIKKLLKRDKKSRVFKMPDKKKGFWDPIKKIFRKKLSKEDIKAKIQEIEKEHTALSNERNEKHEKLKKLEAQLKRYKNTHNIDIINCLNNTSAVRSRCCNSIKSVAEARICTSLISDYNQMDDRVHHDDLRLKSFTRAICALEYMLDKRVCRFK